MRKVLLLLLLWLLPKQFKPEIYILRMFANVVAQPHPQIQTVYMYICMSAICYIYAHSTTSSIRGKTHATHSETIYHMHNCARSLPVTRAHYERATYKTTPPPPFSSVPPKPFHTNASANGPTAACGASPKISATPAYAVPFYVWCVACERSRLSSRVHRATCDIRRRKNQTTTLAATRGTDRRA